MRILIVNGPNLNMLGKREPGIYGNITLKQLEEYLRDLASELGIEVGFFQSNHEGELVGVIQNAGQKADGVILNAGGYTHTSVAIRDAVLCCSVPVVEVHITNPRAREPFRHISLLADVCEGSVSGFGAASYGMALWWFARGRSKGDFSA